MRTEEEMRTADEFWRRLDQALEVAFQGQGRAGEIGYKWLALNVGCSTALIHNNFKGRRMPKIEVRRKMAEVLKVPLADIDPTAPPELGTQPLPHHEAVMDLWSRLDAAEVLTWVAMGKAIVSSRGKA